MTSRPQPELRKTNAFTLVELLVVIAVLGILSALMLPALRRSKQAAIGVACLNNLRQLSLASHLYWDDNADEAFRFREAAANGGDLFWFGWLERGAEGTRRFDRTQGVLWPYLKSSGIEICRAFDYTSEKVKLKATGAAYAYGYNLHLSSPSSRSSLKVSTIPHASQTVLFADSAQVNDFQAPASPERPLLEEFYYVNSTEPTVHFRHGGRANVVFVDGHAGMQMPVPGSLDLRMPEAHVGLISERILLPFPQP